MGVNKSNAALVIKFVEEKAFSAVFYDAVVYSVRLWFFRVD